MTTGPDATHPQRGESTAAQPPGPYLPQAGQPAQPPTYAGQPGQLPHAVPQPPYPGQPGQPPYPGQPAQRTQPAQSGQGGPPAYGSLFSAPASGPSYGAPGQPAGPGYPGQPPASVPPAAPPFAAPAAPRRVGWPGIVALAMVVLLLGVTGFQAYQIHRLGGDLSSARANLGEEDKQSDARVDALESQLATQFDSEKIAAKALPSVFRVRTGGSIGTAFAVGGPASDGGTNLLTNFHVIEDVWESGTKKVKIEHADQLYDATVVAGDKKADVAQLHTTAKIDGLKIAAAESKSGQQILVVGAPLGLKDTVTSGVVSAFRPENSQHGPYIQFDAPINPGNSGGPVINANLEVIGIASAKFTDAEGLALAIPIKVACDKFSVC